MTLKLPKVPPTSEAPLMSDPQDEIERQNTNIETK
jgi:hypothetical protein